jgi:hypothetical protein
VASTYTSTSGLAAFPKSMEAESAFNTGITLSFSLKSMFQSLIMVDLN